jgi:hypothetical protein
MSDILDATADVTIYGPDGVDGVSVIVDGSINRLAVDIGSATITVSDVGLKNSSDVRIDPATEQKQDDIITALGNIDISMEDYEVVEGGIKKLRQQDEENNILLKQIYKELTRISFYLSHLSDLDIPDDTINI